MRTDMAQMLVEKPRFTSREAYRQHRRRANQDPESAPTTQGMRRPYNDRKSFGEHFAPLLGYLRKNVGRPWAKVFSELSASLHGGGAVIDHVRGHLLNDFVVLKPRWIDGKPYRSQRRYHDEEPLDDAYYVDRQGILRYAKHRPRKRTPKPTTHKAIDKTSAFHKIDGVWYRVWLKALPNPSRGRAPVFDLVLKRWVRIVESRRSWIKGEEHIVLYNWQLDASINSGTTELDRLHGKNLVAYRKEQISSRTICREGLDKLKAA